MIRHHDDESGAITINATHHMDAAGAVASHVEGNLTREFHGLSDEHLDNHTAAGTAPDVMGMFHPVRAADHPPSATGGVSPTTQESCRPAALLTSGLL